MIKKIKKYLKGDLYLWAFIILLSLFSFLPIYSASTNLVVNYGKGTAFGFLLKHIIAIIIGFIIIFFIQFVDYKYFGIFSVFSIPIIIILLIVTLIQGININNKINCSRWLNIPGINFSFQTSTFASSFLFIYCARYLSHKKYESIKFFESFWMLIFPIILIIMLIFPANGSTALLIFIWSFLLLFIGNYPLKYLLNFFIIFILFIISFIFISIYFNKKLPENRIYTWKNRIENFFNSNKKENYQISQSKTAIILGGIFGRGPGKSALKIFLPQSSSDFIYSIIIEEYGLIGGLILLFLYMLILFRIIILATKIENYFGRLLIISLGFPIVGQALINIGVSVNIIPVTGQVLPIISSGNTSICMTFLNFGIILNVSNSLKKKFLYEEKK